MNTAGTPSRSPWPWRRSRAPEGRFAPPQPVAPAAADVERLAKIRANRSKQAQEQ
jgi:hypothetical protein